MASSSFLVEVLLFYRTLICNRRRIVVIYNEFVFQKLYLIRFYKHSPYSFYLAAHKPYQSVVVYKLTEEKLCVQKKFATSQVYIQRHA